MEAQEQSGQFDVDEVAYRPPRPSAWWGGALNLLSHPACPAVAAALLLFGLLFAFHQVVSGAVEQGNQRRMTTAAQADGAWRCRVLHGSVLRTACAPAGEAPAPNTAHGRETAAYVLVKPKEK